MRKDYFIFSMVFLGVGGIVLWDIYYGSSLGTSGEQLHVNHQPVSPEHALNDFPHKLSHKNIQPSSSHFKASFSCPSLFTDDRAQIKSDDLTSLLSCIQEVLQGESPDVIVLNDLIFFWVDIDFIGALEFAVNLSEKLQPYTLPAVVQRAAVIDSLSVKEWLVNAHLYHNFDLKQAYYRGVAQFDPKWALRDILTLSNTQIDKQEQMTLLNTVLEQWAEKNADAVVKWLDEKQFEDVELADNIERFKVNVIRQLIKQNDLAAEERILALDAGADKTLLLRNLAKYLSNLDEELAVDWAESLNDPASRKLAMTAALKYWVNNGAAAEKIIDKVLNESHNETRHAVIDDITLELANQNSRKLADLYTEFPQEEHPHIVEKIVDAWVSDSHEEVVDWVQNLPIGTAKDAAIYTIATKAVDNFDRPEQALDMTREIGEHAVQVHARKTILKIIARKDLDKAHEMLVEMRLPVEEMRSIARAFTEQR